LQELKNNEIVLVINTVEERRNAIADSRAITPALLARVTTFTTIAGAEAAVEGMEIHGQTGCHLLFKKCMRC
jgi:carbamoyl-phosphate synthase large subunit